MTTPIDLKALNEQELKRLADMLHVLDERRKYDKQSFLFPDSGPYSRDKYKKHMLFFEAGASYRERAMIAGNRTGKTYTAAAEMSYHLNGRYPAWWKGKRFNEPIKAWEVGKTHETTRDILQSYMLGSKFDPGTGMIPRDDLIWDGKLHINSKSGIPDAVNDAYVKHYTNGKHDGYSQITFKSYVQGVESFMGTSVHVIHLDEEPTTRNIYDECLTRTMTTDGIIMCTFTPLLGLSEVVLSYLPGGKFPHGGIGEVREEADSD